MPAKTEKQRRFMGARGATSELDIVQLKQLLGVGGKAQTCATAMGG